MPDFIDSTDYLNPKRPSRRGRFSILAALLFVAFIVTRIVLSDWVDLLWFKSLGYGDVFWKTFAIESSVFLLSATITFLVL